MWIHSVFLSVCEYICNNCKTAWLDIRKHINILSRIKEGLRKMNMYVLKKCRMLLMMFFFIYMAYLSLSHIRIYII